MKSKKHNVFTISTPSQMMNAIEFIHHFSLQDENNIIVLSNSSRELNNQIKQLGEQLPLIYEELFSLKFFKNKSKVFDKMPLKLLRLWLSKIRIGRIVNLQELDKLILGNYSNFMSQYCTQITKAPIYVLDDGNGSVTRSSKRKRELQESIPFFEFNQKKKALWVVKLIMGFNNYNIPKKFIFFSSYSFDLYGEDELVLNQFNYLKSSFLIQKTSPNLIYFIGSPISEVGYINRDNEIKLILDFVERNKGRDIKYIPHRLDSVSKLGFIKENISIQKFNLPIEIALSMNIELPNIIGGFFSSALSNLEEVVGSKVGFQSLKIPNSFYKTEEFKLRANKIYDAYEKIQGIEIIKFDKE